ncbi:MAG: U2 snRNP complex subunit msl1 [Heterodermia speciosa]|uniref:U2 snRNP complex subunit msl1 n=1 Tax=Heterodermia speciosa TaxID=116794 RepID=A0A8H3FLP2_9LECA|nr:MAG: U2 snRNP complex subunit msl1 [Heterodermia speciosa]
MATRTIPTPNGSAPKPTNPPNQTSLSTLRKPDLRLSLYTLFSTHGPVLDVVALKTAKMRGQAHVVFRDVRDASAALRAENGREFFGAALRVEYAKGRSDVFGRLDGSFSGKGGKGTEGGEGQSSSLQQAIFGKVPGAGGGATTAVGGGPGAGLPPIPPAPAGVGQGLGRGDGEGEGEGGGRGVSEDVKGVKRAREESEDEDGEGAPMEEESDDDVEMEEESGDSD